MKGQLWLGLQGQHFHIQMLNRVASGSEGRGTAGHFEFLLWKKVRRDDENSLEKSHSQPVNLPRARPLMNLLEGCLGYPINGALGCLSFGQKIQKFRFEVKWQGNFPEIPCRNSGLPPKVVLFFHLDWNNRNLLNILQIFQFPVLCQPETITRNQIANGKRHLVCLVCWFWKNPYHYWTVIPTGSFRQMVSTIDFKTSRVLNFVP